MQETTSLENAHPIFATPMEEQMFVLHLKESTRLKASSIGLYKSVINKFLRENHRANLLDINVYNKFISEHVYKKRSSYFHAALVLFIRYKMPNAYLRAELLENMLKPIEHKDYVKKRIYLNEDQILVVINNIIRFKHRIMGILQHMVGVRYHDLITLQEDGMAYEEYQGEQVLRLTLSGKGSKRNVVHVFDKIAIQLFEVYLQKKETRKGYVFLEELINNTKYHPFAYSELDLEGNNYQWYLQDLKQALRESNIDEKLWATHDYRRAFARRFWERHKDIQALQSLLRHSDINTTIKYLEYGGLQNIDYFKEMQTT